MTMDHTSLSELCTTCHTEKPKYRCPRCKAQTCSLQCYKKHQQRASCSGKRDPAVYVKKSQLATPTGIDRDYNYLKGVERNIDHASKDARQRGVGTAAHTSKVATRGWQAGSTLQSYLTDNRITVQRAPVGMSRQKTNTTRVTKAGNVVWTVEWVDGAENQAVQHDCTAAQSIGELDELNQTQRLNAEKRSLKLQRSETNRYSSKRKRPREGEGGHPVGEADSRHKEIILPDSKEGEHVSNSEEHAHHYGTTMESSHDELSQAKEGDGVHHLDKLLNDSRPAVPQLTTEDAQPQAASAQHPEPDTSGKDSTLSAKLRSKSDTHYYLLKPSTIGSSRVLIPLDFRSSLTNALRDQLVLEFPTIFTLVNPPHSLPTSFLLEKQYLAQAKLANSTKYSTKDAVADGKRVDVNTVNRAGGSDHAAAGEVDAATILDMLKRDMLS